MSYDIQVFRKEVKDRYTSHFSVDFFEQEDNFLPFTVEQQTIIRDLLQQTDYQPTGDYTFVHQQEAAVILLKSSVLYCSANTGNGIGVLYVFLDQLLLNDDFKKFDPQDNGWD